MKIIPKPTYDLMNDDPVIRTFTGKWINVFDFKPKMVDIRDIAHALSFQCRFGGHLSQFYSVAQHSIWCTMRAKELKLSKREQVAALLHDASEAYIIDIPMPIKNKLKEYRPIEDKIMKVIAKRYDFNYPLSSKIKDIDREALQVEWDYLMNNRIDVEPIGVYSSEFAEKLFIHIFNKITNNE